MAPDFSSIRNQMPSSPLPVTSFRFPGVLNSQELLVAEAASARAWDLLSQADPLGADELAKARLAAIVVRLMLDRSSSNEDLAVAAIREFKRPA